MNTVRKRQLLHERRQRRNKGGGVKRAILIGAVAILSLGAIAVATGIGALFAIYQHYADDYVPIEQKLRQQNVGLTEVYDRNGVLLGALPNPESQLLDPVPLERMSKSIIDATVSTEDNSFWDNPGINFRGLARAAYENYVTNDFGSGTGGSSITQQLIKNVYICPNIQTDDGQVCLSAERNLDRKLREIVYAIELEKDYSKTQILGWYLNQISYADRYVGVQAAAQGYFHEDAIDLTLAQAALLAGIPQAPTKYHPRLNCAKDENGDCVTDELGRTQVIGEAKTRQEAVLDLMVQHGRATPEDAAAAKAEPLLVFTATNPLKASAWIDNQVEPRLVRMCEAGILPKREGATDCSASVHSAGYRVTSTLDFAETEVAIQYIRGAIETGLANGCNCYNAAIATIDPTNGQVMIYAPNRDYSYTSDRRVAGEIDQLVEINQPGSSFKPVVYLTWFDVLGKTPMSTLWDTSPLAISGVEIRNPRNDGQSGEGLITARLALGGSQNVPAFRAATEAGVDNVIDMAKKVGITTLQQNFDPTFVSHGDVQYGSSIATGGANIRAIDMAYMNSVISNMGVMVGVPTLAKEIAPEDLLSTYGKEGQDYDDALAQAIQFQRGNIRLPGTRKLDPVVVLKVTDQEGNVLYEHGPDLEREQVVNAGSVWLLHSIMSDCEARVIIWGCGSSNNDLSLNAFVDGVRIPGGVKTGTQQGPNSVVDTLETWTNGYSRNAATSVWVGNANNELVRDGTAANFAAANATVRLYKNWMGEYHAWLMRNGIISEPLGFSDLQPGNVAQAQFLSPTTERGRPGGCNQTVTAWIRTDIKYAGDCEPREIDRRNGLLAGPNTPASERAVEMFVKLPQLKPDLAIALAKQRGIPIAPTEVSTGVPDAVVISSPGNGANVNAAVPVIGTVQMGNLSGWTLEIGVGASPANWVPLGSGSQTVSGGQLGLIDPSKLAAGVYTVRLTARAAGGRTLTSSVTFNVKLGPPDKTSTPGPGGGTPTPGTGNRGNGNGGQGN